MVGDIEKAFSRQGAEVHLCELRAGVLPLYVTLPVAFAGGFLLSLFPWAFLTVLRLVLFIASRGAPQNAPTSEDLSLLSALETAWPYGFTFGAVCLAASLLRRYSARRNKYLVMTVGQFAEFRASYGEVATGLGISLALLALSETARDLNILVVMLAPIIGMVLQDLQDSILRLYARLSNNYAAEVIYSVWDLLRTREDARDIKLQAIGAKDKGKTLMVNGLVPNQETLEFLSKLSQLIYGVERVIVNGQELGTDASRLARPGRVSQYPVSH